MFCSRSSRTVDSSSDLRRTVKSSSHPVITIDSARASSCDELGDQETNKMFCVSERRYQPHPMSMYAPVHLHQLQQQNPQLSPDMCTRQRTAVAMMMMTVGAGSAAAVVPYQTFQMAPAAGVYQPQQFYAGSQPVRTPISQHNHQVASSMPFGAVPQRDGVSSLQRPVCRREKPEAPMTVAVARTGGNTTTKRTTTGSEKRRVTSFSIADILDGEVDKSTKDDEFVVHDRKLSDNVAYPGSDNRREQRRIVRPWSLSGRSDSFSGGSSVADDAYDDVIDDDADDDLSDDDAVELDVDDARTSSLAMTSSEQTMCPLGALLRMTTQTNFDSAGNRLQDCFGDDSDGASHYNDDVVRRQMSPSRRHLQLMTSSSTAAIDGVTAAAIKCFRSCKKRRKTRTAFTNQQIGELELRFGRQKYLTPADRDEIASTLRLSSAQVITWFQNRRAKLKRDLEELKADVAAAKAIGNEPSTAVLDRLAELTRASGLQSASTTATRKDGCNGGKANRPR